MKLIIAEKPDIAKAVSKVLPGTAAWKNGYIEQGDWAITWCYGHLLTLKDPEDYGDEFKRENTPNEKLPIFFQNWGTKVADSGNIASSKSGKGSVDKGAQLTTIGKLLQKAALVIIAGDVDDEGQLLVEEVLEWHHYTGPCKRLDTGALNEASMKKAMANLMDNAPWHMRAVSARARSVADFALGINGSRFFSNIYHANLSVGRVQTATLGLVVARDELIENHTAMKYYLLDMLCGISGSDYTTRFVPGENFAGLSDGKVLTKPPLEQIGAKYNGKTMQAVVTKEAVKESPPLPLSISALKTYCSSKFNIPPEETLKITQSLRMNYGGLITYNRSECRFLPENMHSEAPQVVAAVQANLGPVWKFPGLDTKIKSKAFNDKNVGVHHAIIPTTQKADMSKLSDNELKVYKAICGFYMVQFMPDAQKEKTRLKIDCPDGCFESTSTKLMSKGFKMVMETKKDEESDLSLLPAGNYDCTLHTPQVIEKETKPPKRYTDSSLEEDMKNVAKYVTDPEAKRLLLLKDKDSKEEHGAIGTAATRSAIILTLKKRGFLRNEGKNVISTPVGRKFYKILPDEIRKPDLTAKWWAIQQDIQDGKSRPEDLYQEVLASYNRFSHLQYPNLDLSAKTPARPEIGRCPRCGKPVVEGKLGFGCTGYKEGCSFVIWKEGKYGGHKVLAASKKKVTAAMAKKLLEKGKVLVHGLTSEKTGNKYDAYLVLNDTGKGVFLNISFDGIEKSSKKNKKKT